MRQVALAFSFMCLMSLPAFAEQSVESNPMSTEDFSACVARLSTTAKNSGISAPIITGSLGEARFNQRVIELDRQQPEFTTTFADYFNRRVTEQRVSQGRALYKTHRALLDRVAQEYGVPAPYLLAFWGLETNYGSFFGKMSVIDSLTTLACDQRRSEYFTGELLAALRILEEGAIQPARMEGSWAGAMGHVQFMPSAFLRHAIDYDGDGKRDLWNSIPDAMGSAANFLRSLGWDGGSRWGREVQLPAGFDYLQAGLGNQKPLKEWQSLGLRRADGEPLPIADMSASLLVPAGHEGPAFLVYDNFNVIMRWNRSEFYALSVGHLADRIAGAGKLTKTPAENAPRLHRDQVVYLQQQLQAAGISLESADGIFGPATRRALAEFQQRHNMIADGFPNSKTLELLNVRLTP
jgi:membrane-bound lytic murein transglycosylase B